MVPPTEISPPKVAIPETFIVPNTECPWVLIPGTAEVDSPLKVEPSP